MKYISLVKQPIFGIKLHIFEKSIILCFCHHLPERSIRFFGIENYLCARCFGMLCGIIPGLVFLIFSPLPLILALPLTLPMIIDGFVQMLTCYESTNFRRFSTGMLFSIGIFSLLEAFRIVISVLF